MTLTADTLVEIAMGNPINAHIASRLPALGLEQCMLTAGCLFQAVWNHQAGLPVDNGVKDYDIFYFDSDLSWDAEDAVIRAVRALFSDLDANIDIKNQARVHLWYRERFGADYPQLQSTKDGIDRYLVAGTCIGLDVATREVYAPYGLSDTAQGILRINPHNRQPEPFMEKARSYQTRWPWLSIIDATA